MNASHQVTVTSVDLATYEDEISQLQARATAVAGGLDHQAINFSAVEGAWSIGQCLQHLAETHRLYARSFEDGLAAARRKDRTDRDSVGRRFGWFERWFVNTLEPPPQRNFPAPKVVRPSSDLDPDEVRAEYFKGLEGTLQWRREAEGFDLHRNGIASPFGRLIRFRLGAAFAIVAAHDRRHLWQAERVASTANFPR